MKKGPTTMNQENANAKTPAEQAATVEYTRCGRCFRPDVDILECGDELLLYADVPGAKHDSIDVKFEDGMLEIRAEVEPRHASDGNATLLSEYCVGDYCRSFQISETIDASKISAEYANGVLTLHLPKAAALRPRKIAVLAT
jgi:HSP20 family molecular chaperone IbpA